MMGLSFFVRLAWLAVVGSLVFQRSLVTALAVARATIPSVDFRSSTSTYVEQVVTSVSPSVSLQVRKTTDADLDQISEILARASIESYTADGNGAMSLNWNQSIQKLRAKASFHTQLLHRQRAIDAGIKATRKVYSQYKETKAEDVCLLDSDMSRLLWSQDDFRLKIERAATVSSERTLWDHHNFSLAPECPSYLQHLMLSAKDKKTGKIVGFCEVGMLPLSKRGELSSSQSKPIIANLVTSPSCRRQGVASTLIRSASRYVRIHWSSCSELGLFVDTHNDVATSLYKKKGFAEHSNVPIEEGRVYLMRPLLACA
mmetsp:Transcript_45849/g.139258  ORF Transcript_45849/g.139258 Transcript_45849/m.139258 type:complete len:315 (-) Transcript_45849:128-1072(-)